MVNKIRSKKGTKNNFTKGLAKNRGRVADKLCKGCGDLIVKRPNVSWKSYDERQFCNMLCSGKAKRELVVDLGVKDVAFKGGRRMPIEDYVSRETQDARIIADFYIGILRHVKRRNSEIDPKECGTYKGFVITETLYREAKDFCAYYTLGKPGQRRAAEIEEEMTREELLAGIESFG